jgi:threonine/homoserine/homoserine lactone efflux protein
VTATAQWFVVESLRDSAGVVPPAAGIVALCVLLCALVAKTVAQTVMRTPNQRVLGVLNVVIGPLLIVFVIVVLERFRDLT